jgi:hypothetical protein
LHNGNIDALESFQYELAYDFMYQLHGIHDVGTYLSKMWLSTSANQPENERGTMGGYILHMMASQLAKYINHNLVTNKEEKVLSIQQK